MNSSPFKERNKAYHNTTFTLNKGHNVTDFCPVYPTNLVTPCLNWDSHFQNYDIFQPQNLPYTSIDCMRFIRGRSLDKDSVESENNDNRRYFGILYVKNIF